MATHKQVLLGDVIKRASEEIRSWPEWAQPFRPAVGSQVRPQAQKEGAGRDKPQTSTKSR